jgi:hypothetical protein
MGKLTDVISIMDSPDFPIRISRLRRAVYGAGHLGVTDKRAARILGLPLPIFRLIAAYRRAELIEQKADQAANGVMIVKPEQFKLLMRALS